ncbi:hypothetical protein HUU59_06405 [bacterium]|nr:hypothetical protein [bacterium]
MRRFVSVLATACLWFGMAAWANQVSYQGILTNAGGDSLLTGSYDFSFSIFPAATGGTARWTEGHNDVAVENGVYSVLLGETTPLPDSIGASNWLQITVEGTVLTPRLPITADFRAIEARHAQNADSVNHIAARATPTPNHLVPLGADGKFPESVLPFTLDSIIAGQGLTGTPAAPEQRGRNSLDERLTINVGAGTGITVSADQVSATLGTSIATAEIEDNAVTSPKIANDAVNSAKVQDNTLTAADALTNIVSSVDGVVNDGGNIDLIAGENIVIVPNDSANTITFAATGGGGGYSAGRCIELAGTVINNTMTLTAGDSCIRVVYDPATCSYQLSSDLDVFAGNCIEVEYDDVSCDWTVSVDPACVDSIYDTEIYAESFVVIGDGTVEDPAAHLRNDGGLEMRDGEGNEVYINPNGTMVVVQDGVPVGGFDANGEYYAKSFMVIDPETGDTLSHLNNQGGLELLGEDGGIYLNPNGTMVMVQNGEVVGGFDPNGEFAAKSFMVIDPETGDTLSHLDSDGGLYMRDGAFVADLSPGGLFVGDSAGQSGVVVDYFGNVALLSGGTALAGLNGFNGEMYAQSFEVRDSLTGELKAHLSNDGNLELPAGASITVGGVPIGGGEGDTIRRANGGDSSLFGSFGANIFDGLFEGWASAESLGTGSRDGQDRAVLRADGCFESFQNGQKVAGVDSAGEIFAKSFYVWNPSTGDTLIHLKSNGQIEMIDQVFGDRSTISSSYVILEGPDGSAVLTDGEFQISKGDAFAQTDGHLFDTEGTWTATQDCVTVAGLDSTGEIFAKSFYTIDGDGNMVAHLDNDGNLALPDGAQITVGGVPIGGGGIGDEIHFTDDNLNTLMNAGGVAVFDGDGTTSIAAGDLSVSGGNSGVSLSQDGTWQAGQNGVTVAGLQPNGEIHAKSFEVRDSAGGPIKGHLYIEGGVGKITLPSGTVSAANVFGATTVYSSSVSGNTQLASDLAPGYMRTQTLINGTPNAGWTFLNNGQMTARMNGAQILGIAADTYLRLYTCMAMGNFLWSFDPDYVQLAGNLMVNGFFSADNFPGAPGLVGDFLPSGGTGRPAPGTLLVIDPNSDDFVPCFAEYQTSVIGIVSPADTVNSDGEVMTVTYGATAWVSNGSQRPLEVPVRVKADAKYGAIRRGDLLTTSPTEGHAMVANEPKLGTIVGKALESLESGTGEIKVMVTLQ